jgi:NAD-dependent dihydropyrimidine dehydrogenase PreA subunit
MPIDPDRLERIKIRERESGRMVDKRCESIVKVLYKFDVKIGDYERSDDVVGTEFWRPPEVLRALRDGSPVRLETCVLSCGGCVWFRDGVLRNPHGPDSFRRPS